MFDYTKEQILNALNSHPKASIIPTEEQRRAILENPMLENTLESLNKCREFYESAPLYSIPFSMLKRYEQDGDRAEYEYSEQGYFRHRGHLNTWGISAWLYQKPEYIAKLEDALWAVCDEYTWSLPAHMTDPMGLYECLQEDRYTIDLFAAETADTFAELLMMLGDKLDPIVVKRAKHELEKRVLTRFENVCGKGEFWWETAVNNWSAVCAGSIGMAVLCTVDDSERAAKLIEILLKSMRTFMSGFSADGACMEGITYWNYGFGYFCSFADMLYRRTNGEIDLFNDEMVHKVAMFPQKIAFYGSRAVSFSDGGNVAHISLGLSSMLKKHYADISIPESVNTETIYSIDGCHRFALEFHKLLWTPEKPMERDFGFKIHPLPDAQWYIASGEGNFAFAAKAGNNAEPHNHNDVGNFITYRNGEEFFADLGAGLYSKQYFDKKFRYGFYHCGSQGHSVPIINGKTQSYGKDAAARDMKMDERGISMDIASVYDVETLSKLRRTFEFAPQEPKVTIRDEFEFTEIPDNVKERFITKIKPLIEEGKITLTVNNTTQNLLFEPNKFDVTCEEVSLPDHGGNMFSVYLIDFSFKEMSKQLTAKFEII